jgi:hypothetical protein
VVLVVFAKNEGGEDVPKYTSYEAAPADAFQLRAADNDMPTLSFAGEISTGAEGAVVVPPLIVTVELEVTVGVVSEVTFTVTVLVPLPVTAAFSGICAVPRAVI